MYTGNEITPVITKSNQVKFDLFFSLILYVQQNYTCNIYSTFSIYLKCSLSSVAPSRLTLLQSLSTFFMQTSFFLCAIG